MEGEAFQGGGKIEKMGRGKTGQEKGGPGMVQWEGGQDRWFSMGATAQVAAESFPLPKHAGAPAGADPSKSIESVGVATLGKGTNVPYVEEISDCLFGPTAGVILGSLYHTSTTSIGLGCECGS